MISDLHAGYRIAHEEIKRAIEHDEDVSAERLLGLLRDRCERQIAAMDEPDDYSAAFRAAFGETMERLRDQAQMTTHTRHA